MTGPAKQLIAAGMMTGPRPRYDALVDAGELATDPAQEAAADRLQALHEALKRYGGRTGGWFGAKRKTPQGVYLWGDVGRGKTLLMDLFFNNTDFAKKRRVHFHEFMGETHERIAHWRAANETEKRRHKAYNRASPDDPMPPAAYDIAQDARLLCFDEFHVTDIADAMILGRLFKSLLEEGVVIVATSNRAPDDLYADGLNRQLFLPFIDMLKASLDILELQSAQDYRLAKLTAAPVYMTPLGAAADKAMDEAWARMLSGGHERVEEIHLKGRILKVPRAARGAARFAFEDLCARPLGAADYLAIARRYGALFVDRIPEMGPDMRNEAKRFSTLIDTLYDAGVKLVCSAEAEPMALYTEGTGAFEFERTASRLMEMRTADYLGKASVQPD